MKNILLFLILTTLFMSALFGCSSKDVSADDQNKKVAYYCKETGKIVVTTKQETPAINPQTSRRTLLPTMYCEQCKRWQPVPSIELLQRTPHAGLCKKCRKPLVAEGPLPEKTN